MFNTLKKDNLSNDCKLLSKWHPPGRSPTSWRTAKSIIRPATRPSSPRMSTTIWLSVMSGQGSMTQFYTGIGWNKTFLIEKRQSEISFNCEWWSLRPCELGHLPPPLNLTEWEMVVCITPCYRCRTPFVLWQEEIEQ